MNAGVTQLVEYQLPMLNVEGSSPFARSTVPQPLAFQGTHLMPNRAVPSDTKWVFQLSEGFHQQSSRYEDSPLAREFKYFFPDGFVPDQKAEYVVFRFEIEGGSYWGGEDINLRARFDEFFKWSYKSHRDGSTLPMLWHRPAWLTLRAWQLLRLSVSRRNWNAVPSSELTVEVLQSRKDYYDKGMYLIHGFPARLVITLE